MEILTHRVDKALRGGGLKRVNYLITVWMYDRKRKKMNANGLNVTSVFDSQEVVKYSEN